MAVTGRKMSGFPTDGQLIHRSEHPSENNVICTGWQENIGKLCSAVAHTKVGDIPGKAKYPDTCWYPYFGKEIKSDNFSFVVAGRECVSQVWSKPRPANALKLGREGDLKLCLAIADTKWGKIPGKAAPWGEFQEGKCWFSYDGIEYSTNSFSWVCKGATEGQLIHRSEHHSEDNVICIGWQKNIGKLCSAVAHTKVGDIPGKAKYPDTCWYPYFGKEIKSDNFSFVVAGRNCVSQVWSKPRPTNALKLGREGDLKLCLAIADTKWGKIPGKAAPWGEFQEGKCWFSYDGIEYSTDSFSWVCKGATEDQDEMTSTVKLTHQNQSTQARNLICLGFDEDGEELYSAVAHTDYGDIPGKAKYPNLCWYPYFGKEYTTENFSFVSVEKDNVTLVWSKYQPSHALKLGHEGDLVLSLAIADTEWGRIPGKAARWGEAQEGVCWYSRGGIERSTTSFSWVCEKERNDD